MKEYFKNFNSSFIRLLLIFLTGLDIAICQDFGYDGDKGPSHWGEQYNSCAGKHQSPININSLNVERVTLPPLQMIGFDVPPDKTTIKNNGHTVMITMDAETKATISGGPLAGGYEFEQLHFHWGDNDTFGSEDLIDGKSFPMELHMVFYKNSYRNVRSALDHSDGLTVLAFFYDIVSDDNVHYKEFSTVLSNVTSSNTTTSFEQPPTLRDLIPSDLKQYYTYNGSLTTPPCSEVVTWIDFMEPILLSHKQLEMFRVLRDENGNHLTHNFRPIQPLGDRIVLYNIDDHIALKPITFEDDLLKPITFKEDLDNNNNNNNVEIPPPSEIDTRTQFEINNKSTDELNQYTYIEINRLDKNILNERPNNNLDEDDDVDIVDADKNQKSNSKKNDQKSNQSSAKSIYNISFTKYNFIFILLRLICSFKNNFKIF